MNKELFRKQYSLELLEIVMDNMKKYQITQFPEFLEDAQWFAQFRQAYVTMWQTKKPLDLSKCNALTTKEINEFYATNQPNIETMA